MMICPKCRRSLVKVDRTYKCSHDHSYDIASQGYVNLLLSKTDCGDNQDLVKARARFLEKGFYLPLACALKQIIFKYHLQNILDCGCGVGYYTKYLNTFVSEMGGKAQGIDISKHAISYAQKHDKNTTYIVASNYDIPYEEATFEGCLYVFAPSCDKESARVLKSNGKMIIVSPTSHHLLEAKELLYDNVKTNEKEVQISNNFRLLERREISFLFTCEKEDLTALISMTPYIYKTNKKNLERLDGITSLEVTAAFFLSIYEKIAEPGICV